MDVVNPSETESADGKQVPNWNSLPNEMKFKVVEHLGREAKLSLRKCSRHDQQIVDYKPFKKVLHKISIQEDGRRGQPKWKMQIFIAKCIILETCRFDNEEHMCHVFNFHMDHYDGLEVLEISAKTSNLPSFDISRGPRRQRQIEVIFCEGLDMADVIHVVQQIKPKTLSRVHIRVNHPDPIFFSLPQILHAHHLRVYFLQEEQEFDLPVVNASILEMYQLSHEARVQHLRNCLAKADPNNPSFFWLCQPDVFTELPFRRIKSFFRFRGKPKWILDTPFPDLKFFHKVKKCQYSGFGRICKMDSKGRLLESDRAGKLIEDLVIFVNYRDVFSIKFKNEPEESYYCNHYCGNLKPHLRRKIFQAGPIKHLQICKKPEDSVLELVRVGKEKPLAVKELELQAHYEKDGLKKMLVQFQPEFLQSLTIEMEIEDETVFEMPQILLARNLNFHMGVHVRDSHLLKFDAEKLIISKRRCSRRQSQITVAGVNQYIKKCLSDLDWKNIFFKFHLARTTLYDDRFFADLNFSSEYPLEDDSAVLTIIDSDHPTFLLKVVSFTNRDQLIGKRILRKELGVEKKMIPLPDDNSRV